MRNKSKIIEEIVELSAIKSVYNHYLGSWRSLSEVENTTTIMPNLKTISRSLSLLYAELAQQKQVTVKKPQHPQRQTVLHSAGEQNAILHFNKDKRFKINE